MPDNLFLTEPPAGKKGSSSQTAASTGDSGASHQQIEGQVCLSPKELSSELFSVSLLIQQSKEIHQKLGHICDALVNLCGFSFASVILFNDTPDSLRIRLAHIKTLSNAEGLKTRDFFESVARPGTELIRQYYDTVFQDQFEVVNTYCVPPETTYPILQASGISEPKVASYLISFGVVPQVLDDSRHRTIMPPTKRTSAQKTRIFLSDNRPIQIFIALYNGTLPSDENETYGLYLPIRNSNGKILGLLSIGPRTVEANISQETALAYHCAFEPLIGNLALELENDALRSLVSTGQSAADLFRPSDFTHFLAGLEQHGSTQDKLDFICHHILKQLNPEVVFGVLFNGSLLIENTSLTTRLSNQEKELTEFYQSNFSVGTSIQAEFLGSLFIPEYQVSNSFFFTDEQLSSVETYSQSHFGFRKGVSKEKLAKEGTLFTPIYNKSGLITGYIAAVFDPRPTDAGLVAEAIEFYAQFISNEPAISSKAPLDQAGHQTQFASVFDLADSIHYYPTLEEKAHALARGILRIGGLSTATIVLYDNQDRIEHQQTYSALENEEAPPARPATLCKSGGIEKFASEAIFMTPGFKFNQCYSFSADQVLQLLSELETGNEAPLELSSSFVGEENFEKFLSDPNTGIFIPIQSGKNIFGYVGLGDPLPDTTADALKDRLSLLNLFINKAATHLWQVRLEEETAEQSRGKASLRDLLSSLLATSEQIQSDAPVEAKIEKVMHAIVELFGLTYAALALYDKNYRIAYSSCKFHSQSVQTNLEKTFGLRFNPGRQLSEQVLHTIFSEPFSAGPCAIFKVSQLKAALRKKPLSYSKRNLSVLNNESVSATSLSVANISDYLNGDRHIGLMLPLYGEQGRLAGTVSLGSQMFSGNIASTTELIERIKIIAHFTDQTFRDYQLSQAQMQREEESRKLRKKNIFIQTLLELNITLAQPFSMHEKIKAVCERSVESSDFCSIGVLLLSGDDLVITDYYQATNPRASQQSGQTPNEFFLGGNKRLNSEFLTHVLDEGNLTSNSYCYDFRQIAGRIEATGNTESIVILNGSPVAYTTPVTTEGALGHEDAFKAFYNATQDKLAPVTIITPMFASDGHLLGLVTIGKVSEDIKKTGTEVQEDIELMELIARILSRNLENALLTERLGRSDSKFRNVVENVQHGFILFDTTGRIEYVNGFIRQILGYQSEEMIGKFITDFVHPDYIPEAERQQQTVLRELKEADTFSTASFSDYELLIFSNEGEAIPFLVTTTPEMTLSASGHLTGKGWFSLLVDLRHSREIERKQKEMATIRNNFFAMVVHDMKVPLSAIYGYSDMLKTINPGQVDEDYFHKIVSRIHLSAKNINTLIQEILDFSKYESGMISLDLQHHSLVLCLDLVLEQNLHDLNKKKITINREIGNSDFYFRFDFDKLVRVLGNIISNAIKFSKHSNAIDISIHREVSGLTPSAKVMIKDHGEGIHPDEIDLIFDAYRQATSKLSPLGSGLGLSIAKHIVELHGGRIWAESQLGEGTSICFTLPMSNVNDDVSLKEEF